MQTMDDDTDNNAATPMMDNNTATPMMGNNTDNNETAADINATTQTTRRRNN
jgi:hypothetical protein